MIFSIYTMCLNHIYPQFPLLFSVDNLSTCLSYLQAIFLLSNLSSPISAAMLDNVWVAINSLGEVNSNDAILFQLKTFGKLGSGGV